MFIMYTTYKKQNNNGKTMTTKIRNYTMSLRKEVSKKDVERRQILEELKTVTNPDNAELCLADMWRLTAALTDAALKQERLQKKYDQVVKIRLQCKKESGLDSAVHYHLCIAKSKEEKAHGKQLIKNADHRYETMFFKRIYELFDKKYDVLTPIN